MWYGLYELKHLWLNFNQITTVWHNGFANLPLLERLVLNDNALTTLEANAFSPIDTPGIGHPTDLVLSVSQKAKRMKWSIWSWNPNWSKTIHTKNIFVCNENWWRNYGATIRIVFFFFPKGKAYKYIAVVALFTDVCDGVLIATRGIIFQNQAKSTTVKFFLYGDDLLSNSENLKNKLGSQWLSGKVFTCHTEGHWIESFWFLISLALHSVKIIWGKLKWFFDLVYFFQNIFWCSGWRELEGCSQPGTQRISVFFWFCR